MKKPRAVHGEGLCVTTRQSPLRQSTSPIRKDDETRNDEKKEAERE